MCRNLASYRRGVIFSYSPNVLPISLNGNVTNTTGVPTMAIKRQAWIVSVMLMGAAARLLVNDPIVRLSSAQEFLPPIIPEVIPQPSIPDASVACDEILIDGGNPSLLMVSSEAMFLQRSNARRLRLLITGDQQSQSLRSRLRFPTKLVSRAGYGFVKPHRSYLLR